MSISEGDTMSDSNSNLESPFSQTESPYSSPSQQVPQLVNNISELKCVDDTFMHNARRPELCIVEQPQNHFRFRYKSEMVGTHGCLLGTSYSSSKLKTHPTVELKNFTGKAVIRCQLARHDNHEEHPHKLLEDDQDREVSSVVPMQGVYRVAFSGMGIIHTAKKDVPAMLYKKYATDVPDTPYNENKLRVQCENEAKAINLNIVRLKFSAHDHFTGKEICPPVFSEPIHNMKSAATNDLKICRISRLYGRPKGGDDVFLFVEKVNKKNIMIRFFEVDDNGDRIWTALGTFLQSDVHHQYAIVFRTPAYRDTQISSDVKVQIELVRPSDGRTSEPKEFTYKAESIHRQSKKRKANSSYSSLDSISGSSVRSFNDIPVTVEFQNGNFNRQEEEMNEIPAYTIKMPSGAISVAAGAGAGADAEALMADAMWSSSVAGGGAAPSFSPLLSAPNVPAPPVLTLHSSEMDRILERSIPPDERRQFLEADLGEYFRQFEGTDIGEPGAMDFIKSAMMVADSGRATNVKYRDKEVVVKEENTKNIMKKTNNEYSAFYKSADGIEVKKLVKEICEMIRNKSGHKKQMVRTKLEKLFDMRLSNGDTFLHMSLCSNQPSLEYMVKLIYSMKMTKLLNLKNNQMQTLLHLAVINDSPRLVSFLVSKGCNPMEEDGEGNNAIHYAVMCQSCIVPLLEAIKTNSVACDLNAYNNEKQTALHLSVVFGCAESARALAAHGASLRARDAAGRTPLHLAALDDCRAVAAALLARTPASDIDALDGKGYTALQIVCDGKLRENTLEIAKMLLEKKADPTIREEYNQPAWKLARDKPALLQLLQAYMNPQLIAEDDIKSEPEDDYESADEGHCD